VHGVHECEKESYIFTEMIDGITLDALRGRIDVSHCYEILAAMFKAVTAIDKRGYWHTDLDFGNVLLGRGESGVLVRLIDIDSCIPAFTTFKSYMETPQRRLNVNERYWSYVISSMQGDALDRLKGRSIYQSAFMPFAVDLFFNIKYPDRSFSLKPDDLNRLMKPSNRNYFPQRAKKLWRYTHRQLLSNPQMGVQWASVDEFVTAAFRFPQRLAYASKAALLGESIVDAVVSVFDRLFRLWD